MNTLTDNIQQHDIVLATINARYIHAAFGLRYLYANMQELQDKTAIMEFNINQQAEEICEHLLAKQAKIIGFGVYIWNTDLTFEVITLIKLLKPETIIILGGPEISYETKTQNLYSIADYIITGMADLSFYQTCKNLLPTIKDNSNVTANPFSIMPGDKVIAAGTVSLTDLALPYEYYTDTDIANRILYVEASRGCPFKCEFCLSSLDKTAWPFSAEIFLAEMERLYNRGARNFKFVDRTFNLKVKTSLQILHFFLDKIKNDNAELFLHFELIPDNLPEPLKELLVEFPEGCLQFEIGIQTFTPEVQQNISRRQDTDKSKANIRWLIENTKAHLHTDLIFALPGESMATFHDSFNQLVALRPHEIQFGILKRLKGTPLVRHEENFKLTFNTFSPYNILANIDIDYMTMREMNRFSRYWDMVYNSGRFAHSIEYIIGDDPFGRFALLSRYIYQHAGATHKIALQRLFEFVYRACDEGNLIDPSDNNEFLKGFMHDFYLAGYHHVPNFIEHNDTTENIFNDIRIQAMKKATIDKKALAEKKAEVANSANKRQKQHINS